MDVPAFETSDCVYAILAGVIPAMFGAYFWFRPYNPYWKERKVPYEPSRSLADIIYTYSTKDHSEVEMERYQKYGRICGYFEDNKPHILISDPEILQDILMRDFQYFTSRREFGKLEPVFGNFITTLNGEEWKRVRTIVLQVFNTARLRKMAVIINDSTKALIDNFTKHADNDTPADCRKLFGAFTMDVIATTAFAKKIDSADDPDNQFVVNARNTFAKHAALKTISFFILPTFLRNLVGMNFLDKGSVDFFRGVTLEVMEHRQNTGEKGNDFLQLMLDAYQEHLEAETKVEEELSPEVEDKDKYGETEANKQGSKTSHRNKCLSKDEMLSQCVMFFIMGYETSAATLAFIAYNLARNPEVQEKLIEEIDTIAGGATEISYDVIGKMKYLDRVVSETLRLQPPTIKGENFISSLEALSSISSDQQSPLHYTYMAPAPFVQKLIGAERTAVADYKLKGRDITVEKGMVVGFCMYAMHHDPEFFPEPEVFNPDRFLPGNSFPTLAFLPFGAGPRHCLGRRFALMEVKICMAHVLRHFRFKTCFETKIPLEFVSNQGFLTPKDLVLKVEKRTDQPQTSGD